MYLIIEDDGRTLLTERLLDEDLYDDSIIRLLDITDLDNPKEFYNKEWRSIKEVER